MSTRGLWSLGWRGFRSKTLFQRRQESVGRRRKQGRDKEKLSHHTEAQKIFFFYSFPGLFSYINLSWKDRETIEGSKGPWQSFTDLSKIKTDLHILYIFICIYLNKQSSSKVLTKCRSKVKAGLAGSRPQFKVTLSYIARLCLKTNTLVLTQHLICERKKLLAEGANISWLQAIRYHFKS